jgi:hypothetical protein
LTASIASGNTTNKATARTMPPVSAISVRRSRWKRGAVKPPRKVETTVTPARGIAIHVIRSSSCAPRAAPVDVDLVRVGNEAVTAP